MINAEIVRELEESDLALLETDRGVKAPTLRRLTDMHHCIARLVAQGEAGYAIAMATGYSQSRISILKADPAFQELVAHYREAAAEIYEEHQIDIAKKMAAVLSDTLDVQHDYVLSDDPDIRNINDIAKFVADRAGYGPASKSTNTNFTFDLAGALAAGRQRAEELTAAVPAARGLLPPKKEE
jgi:hypothetical protein